MKKMSEAPQTEERIVCAALYAQRSPDARVSAQWLETIVPYLADCIPIRECSYYGMDGAQLGRGSFEDLEAQLATAILGRSVTTVVLNAHRERHQDLSLCWQASANIQLEEGDAFLGVPLTQEVTGSKLLRHLYSASRTIVDWRYGIAYTHSSWRAP